MINFVKRLGKRESLSRSALFLFCLMFLVNQTPDSVTSTQTFTCNHTAIYGRKLDFYPKTFLLTLVSIPLCSANLPIKSLLGNGNLILVFPLLTLRTSKYCLANFQFYYKSLSTLLTTIYNIMHLDVTRLVNLILTKFVLPLLSLQVHTPRIQPRGAIFFQTTFINLSGALLHNESLRSSDTILGKLYLQSPQSV